MGFLKYSLLLAVIAVNLWECFSYKACKNIKPVENWDRDHFLTNDKKHYVIATSECQNCEKGDKAWHWLRQRTNPMKVCMKVHGITPEGFFNIDAWCEMANPEVPRLNCELDFSKYETKIKMKGAITIIASDLENYFVTNFCIFGKENIWYITSLKPTLDASLKQELLDKLVEMGFDSNEAVEGVSPVFIKNTTNVPCK